MSLVLNETSDGIAILTLNRPEAMNALSLALQKEIAEAFDAIAADDAVKVVILTGAGERAFSAGLDLKEIGQFGLLTGPGGRRRDSLAAPLARCPKPIVGAINGVAVTGGFEVALACDILIGSTNARFADTHARVGVTPGSGLSQKLPRLIGIYRAKRLSLTGNFIDAQTALDWGLLSDVVAPQDLMPTARALAAEIASSEPEMVQRYKRLIDDGYALPFGEAMVLERARAEADSARLRPEDVEARRAAVIARGREQQG
ncbi:enoyl-CoA hydratase [Sphingobium sp. Sx8-8]|uniref:enoyl-CoA hydratase n=1 Tax=Sphingobium sp. Sx8-8 TaxID=2933617 RepID=UPI001F5818B5|nr:enoyl-CoA hydratase [Sphingobium sp. Sx8-8]